MKKVKIGFWVLLIAFLLLVGYQNKAFFLQKNTFGLNLYVTDAYMTPEIYNGVLFGVCFVTGLIIAYFFGLFDRFRANKTIKQLNMDLETQRQQVESLTTELNAFKNVSAPAAEQPATGDDDAAKAEATQVLS
ncbi:MAG: LapA family protein [Desulfobacterales bacterium]|nr:LapA family protein [Desulfobacterales bacterium]